jgi:hypothetical protein
MARQRSCYHPSGAAQSERQMSVLRDGGKLGTVLLQRTDPNRE